MIEHLRRDAENIVAASVRAVLPDAAVRSALADFVPGRGAVMPISVGKAAWRMARAASEVLSARRIAYENGLVITKYGHVQGEIPGFDCLEAGHPVPDENSFNAARIALKRVRELSNEDTVILLLSGGGSALFELPLLPAEELSEITAELLRSGADITEINTVRKRLSGVKGGRFALACAPAKVYQIILSDVVGGRNEMVASGPAYPDSSAPDAALAVAAKYGLTLSEKAAELLKAEPVKALDNVTTRVSGSVSELCRAAAESCANLGYTPEILTDSLTCEAREAGRMLGELARKYSNQSGRRAFIAGGETVVKVTGSGKGGRNQEVALAAAEQLQGMSAAVFSIGSDGTDGPTDAAGGYVDGDTLRELAAAGIDPETALRANDSYTALNASGGLIFTGPTGTNVNDVAVLLLDIP